MRKSREGYFVDMLQFVAARSTCARRAVGAIITDNQGIVLSMGYNGTPRGWTHCLDHECPGALDPTGNSARCYAVHAEQNALLQCQQLFRAHTLYVTCSPCFTCAKMIVQTNVERIIFIEPYVDTNGWSMLKMRLLYRYDSTTDTIHLVS